MYLSSDTLATHLENHMESACTICQAMLTGRQTKFCSRGCKNASTNNKHQNYISQQHRGGKEGGFSLNKKAANANAAVMPRIKLH
jgi:hypothetical protein